MQYGDLLVQGVWPTGAELGVGYDDVLPAVYLIVETLSAVW